MRTLLAAPLAASLLALTAPLAACGGSPSAAPSSPAATGVAIAPSGGGSAPAAQSVTVHESEFKLDPAAVSVKAGTVTFQVVDDGQAPHDLHIAPKGSSAEVGASQRVTAGGTTSFTVTLQPGTYDMWCGVPGHRNLGMQGTVTVS